MAIGSCRSAAAGPLSQHRPRPEPVLPQLGRQPQQPGGAGAGDPSPKTALSAALTAKDNRNYIEDVFLETSSRKLSILGLSASHSRKLAGGVLGLEAGYARGLKILGAERDDEVQQGQPKAQFELVSGDLSYLHPLPAFGLDFAYSGLAHGQWTKDTLYSTERIGIGGKTSVRGFKEQTITGDVGGYLRNELIWTLPATGEPLADDLFGRLRLFAAYDLGAIRADDIDPFERGIMAGWAVGLRGGGRLGYELTYAEPMDAPAFITERDPQIYFTLSLTF